MLIHASTDFSDLTLNEFAPFIQAVLIWSSCNAEAKVRARQVFSTVFRSFLRFIYISLYTETQWEVQVPLTVQRKSKPCAFTCVLVGHLPVWDRGRSWSTGQPQEGRRGTLWYRWGAPWSLGPLYVKTEDEMSKSILIFYLPIKQMM